MVQNPIISLADDVAVTKRTTATLDAPVILVATWLSRSTAATVAAPIEEAARGREGHGVGREVDRHISGGLRAITHRIDVDAIPELGQTGHSRPGPEASGHIEAHSPVSDLHQGINPSRSAFSLSLSPCALVL